MFEVGYVYQTVLKKYSIINYYTIKTFCIFSNSMNVITRRYHIIDTSIFALSFESLMQTGVN